MNINKYISKFILPAISKVLEKTIYERIFSFFALSVLKNLFWLKQIGFCSKRSTPGALAKNAEKIRQGITVTYTCIMFDLVKYLIQSIMKSY